jgi:hypothetical protein
MGTGALIYLIMHWCKLELYYYYAKNLIHIEYGNSTLIFMKYATLVAIAQCTASKLASYYAVYARVLEWKVMSELSFQTW